jgi:hypothetical protein
LHKQSRAATGSGVAARPLFLRGEFGHHCLDLEARRKSDRIRSDLAELRLSAHCRLIGSGTVTDFWPMRA